MDGTTVRVLGLAALIRTHQAAMQTHRASGALPVQETSTLERAQDA